MNNKPEFLQGLQRIAEQSNMEYIEAYRMSADEMATRLIRDKNAWRSYVPGVMLWLDDCGLKMDGAKHIGGVIETMQDCDTNYIHSRLAMVEKIIECSDEDLQLFNYSNGLPAGCGMGGTCIDDIEAANKQLELFHKDYISPSARDAAEQKYYGYIYTLVTMVRSDNYCLFIDAEQSNWCEYIFLLPTWREMYADDIKAIEDEKERIQAEDDADTYMSEVQEQYQYETDCDRLRPYMVADLSAFALDDRKSRQSGRRRNIMAALRHFFPGQKFSVKTAKWCIGSVLQIDWTDGPTEEAVKNCCNWSLFCDRWQSFDSMDDSWDCGSRKNIDFAEKYGGGVIHEIKFKRTFSIARRESATVAACSLLVSCGVEETKTKWGDKIYEVYTSDLQGSQVLCAIANCYGDHVADLLEDATFINQHNIALALMENNAD